MIMFLPLLKRILPYAAGFAILLGIYLYVRYDAYNSGVEDTITKYEQMMQQERDRLKSANEQALSDAREKITTLNNILRLRDGTIKELNRQASEDPNAGHSAIGLDSVRRINRIR